MNVRAEMRDGVAVIVVEGEVDLSTSPRLRDLIHESLRGAAGLVVDLAACTYMDSSGIATLVEALQAAGKARVCLGLAGVEGRVKDIFTLARLGSVFSIHPDAASAVRAVLA